SVCELGRRRPPETCNSSRYASDLCIGKQGELLLTRKRYLHVFAVGLVRHSYRHSIPEEPILPGFIFHVLHHVAADRKHHARVTLATVQDPPETFADAGQYLRAGRLDPCRNRVRLNVDKDNVACQPVALGSL